MAREEVEIRVFDAKVLRPVLSVRRQNSSWSYFSVGGTFATTKIESIDKIYSVQEVLDSFAERDDPSETTRILLGYVDMEYSSRARHYSEAEVESASRSIDSSRGTWGAGYPSSWDTLMKVVYGAKKRGELGGSRDDNLNLVNSRLSRMAFVGDTLVRCAYPICWVVIPPGGKQKRSLVETYELNPDDLFIHESLRNGLVFLLAEKEEALARAAQFGHVSDNEVVEIHDPNAECANPALILCNIAGKELLDLADEAFPELFDVPEFAESAEQFDQNVDENADPSVMASSLDRLISLFVANAPVAEQHPEFNSLRTVSDKAIARIRAAHHHSSTPTV
ncbi:hypothetical protein ACVIGB_000442 [Bradyrhizobium sp. USDA 4341]